MAQRIISRYKNLYKQHTIPELEVDYKKSDLFMVKLIAIHWLLASTLSAYYYQTYLLGFVGGGIIFGLTYASYHFYSGTQFFRIIAGIALLSFSVIFIQQHLGRIEMHFHVFVALSFLTVYKNLIPLTSGAIFITLHHLVFNYLQEYNVHLFDTPIVVFNYGCGLSIVFLHAFFVLFEWIILNRVIRAQKEQYKNLVSYQNQIEEANAHLEDAVHERTKELEIAIDEAESANKMKSEFLANMSHEIRTPMNAVLGFTELLDGSIKDPTNKSYLNSIKSGTKTLLTIINDILDLSKIEAGKLHIEFVPVNPHTLLEEIEHLFSQKISQKKLGFLFEVDPKLPQALILDEVRIRQVLFNLLSNAIKFTHSGRITLRVKTLFHDDDNSKLDLSIEVEDTGIGIAQDQQERIFHSFIQQDGQQTREYGGTGLGLTISERLAQLMNGEIILKSKENKGSTFTLLLHDVSVSAGNVEDQLNRSQTDCRFDPATIMVVDDIEANRRLIAAYLKEFPFEVIMAKHGKDALSKLSDDIDLIVMDIKMPVMNGYDATNTIKNDPVFHKIPVIALTASVTESEEAIAQAKFDGFLKKPISKAKLLNEFTNFLEHQKIQNSNYIAHASKDVTLSEKCLEHKAEYIERITKNILPELKESKDSGDTDVILNFSHFLNETGKEFELDSLMYFAKDMQDAIGSFDIEAINRTYINLEKHLDKLLKELKA